MQTLRIKDFIASGHACHVAVSRLDVTEPPPHTHDFDELFWVETGQGRHLINREVFPLRPGSLVTILAGDRHALCPQAPLSIINIAFPRRRRRDLLSRYHCTDPWHGNPAARHRSISGMAHSLLAQHAAELLAGSRTDLALDRFLLNLIHLLQTAMHEQGLEQMPDWLAYACREVHRPEHLRRGTPALVDLAGRSPEHVSRAMRRFTGKTPTDYINDLRLAAAAQRLAQCREPIAEVAMEVGLSNLAHFYSLFNKRFGTTPSGYRKRQHIVTGRPG